MVRNCVYRILLFIVDLMIPYCQKKYKIYRDFNLLEKTKICVYKNMYASNIQKL
jgi:hypothetical protein